MISNNIKIIKEASKDFPFFVIHKPRGLPSAPLFENDSSALTRLIEKFQELKNVNGRKQIEYGLLHRIDNDTEGLLLVAATNEAYEKLLEQQKNGQFVKNYEAICEDFLLNKEAFTDYPSLPGHITEALKKLKYNQINLPVEINLSSQFRHYQKEKKIVRPVNKFSGKAALKKASGEIYSTKITIANKLIINGKSFYKIQAEIKKGFKHQVRCHAAWIGLPVCGDIFYSPVNKDRFCFSATGLSFINPVNGKLEKFSVGTDFENIDIKAHF